MPGGSYEIRRFGDAVGASIERIITANIANGNAATVGTATGGMTVQRNTDGTVTFRAGSLALASNGGNVIWTTYQVGIQSQRWYLEPHSVSYNLR